MVKIRDDHNFMAKEGFFFCNASLTDINVQELTVYYVWFTADKYGILSINQSVSLFIISDLWCPMRQCVGYQDRPQNSPDTAAHM